MSKNINIILLAILCGVMVLGVGFWRYKVAGKSKPSYAVIVRDRSDSVLSGCDCTAALAKRAFGNHQVGAGSTVTITVTGDATTAGEPKAIASVEVPVSRQVLEGRDAALQQRDKLLCDLKAQCEMAVQTKVSPIFIAIRQAVEHLRGLGCGPDSNCLVYVQSDLEETGDPQMRGSSFAWFLSVFAARPLMRGVKRRGERRVVNRRRAKPRSQARQQHDI